MTTPLSKEHFDEAIEGIRGHFDKVIDDVLDTLTKRSEAVENKLDAHELDTKENLRRIEGKLDAALLLDLEVADLKKRLHRVEQHLHL